MSNQSVDGSSGNNKIPEYAMDFKNECLFIRGVNKELDSFVDRYLIITDKLVVSSYNGRIKYFIKKFMKAQELGYLKDISCFKFKKCDFENIAFIFENIVFLFEIMNFDFEEDDYSEYRYFYELFCKFYNKINFDSD